jgi:hypothetical protein
MKPKTYYLLTATLLAVVAILHAVRAALHLPVQIGTWEVPMWMSVGGMLVTGTLSVLGFTLARK